MKVREFITALEATGKPNYDIEVSDGQTTSSLTGLGNIDDTKEVVTIQVAHWPNPKVPVAPDSTDNPNDSFETEVKTVNS